VGKSKSQVNPTQTVLIIRGGPVLIIKGVRESTLSVLIIKGVRESTLSVGKSRARNPYNKSENQKEKNNSTLKHPHCRSRSSTDHNQLMII
jgi:hypothetical protein